MSFLDTLGTTIVNGVSGAFNPASLIPAAISFIGGERRNQQSAASAQAANEFSAQQYATRYQTTVKDMQAAGLNPMLAYQQGTGSSQPSGQQAQFQDTMSPAVSAYQAQELQDSQATANYASAQQSRAAAKLANETVNKTVQEVENLKTDQQRNAAVIDNLHEEYHQIKATVRNLAITHDQIEKTVNKIVADTNLVNKNSLLTEVETRLKQFDVNAAQSWGNLGRSSKEVKTVLDVLQTILRGK